MSLHAVNGYPYRCCIRVPAVSVVASTAERSRATAFMTSRACVSDWLQAAYAEVVRLEPDDPMAALAARCRNKAASLGMAPPVLPPPVAAAGAAGAGMGTDELARNDPRMIACRKLRELGVPHFLW